MKIHWAKETFWELDLQNLQEWFEDDEKLALSYLSDKFWYEVTEDIKNRAGAVLINE